MLHGSLQKIRGISLVPPVGLMQGITISPIFGLIFAAVGLAVAVLLGAVLYKDKSPKASGQKTVEESKEVEAA